MKNVLVLGAGISGLGAAHVLLRHECNVIVSDLKDNIKIRKKKKYFNRLGSYLNLVCNLLSYWMESIQLWFHQLFLLRI